MSKKSINNHERFRDGIMRLNGHQFGRVGEVVVETLMGYTPSGVPEFDLLDTNGQMVEVKTAKVQEGSKKRVNVGNFYDVAMNYARWERLITQQRAVDGEATFACNIQRIKPNLFDRLVYLLFFKDLVEIFAIDGDDLDPDNPDLGYSSEPSGIGLEEGYLRINGKTYGYHNSNHLVQSVSYGDLMKVAKANKSTD